jgi:hypothetical protein
VSRPDRDDLYEAAFEGLALDRELTPSEEEELRLLEGMKLQLRSLGETPPCQLSAERMRRAILNAGIEKPRSAGLPWWSGWGIAAAAACAFMAYTIFPRPASAPVVQVAMEAREDVPLTLNAPLDTRPMDTRPLETASTEVRPTESIPPAAVESRPRPVRVAAVRRSEPTVAPPVRDSEAPGYRVADRRGMPEAAPSIAAAGLSPEIVGGGGEAAPGMPDATLAAAATAPIPLNPAAEVVVISSPALDLGDPLVSEVSRSGNVLFGG